MFIYISISKERNKKVNSYFWFIRFIGFIGICYSSIIMMSKLKRVYDYSRIYTKNRNSLSRLMTSIVEQSENYMILIFFFSHNHNRFSWIWKFIRKISVSTAKMNRWLTFVLISSIRLQSIIVYNIITLESLS